MAMTFGGNPTPADVARTSVDNIFTSSNNLFTNQTAISSTSVMTRDLVSNYIGPYMNVYSGGGISPSLYSNAIFAPIINDRFGAVAAPGFNDRCLCFDLFYLPKQINISKVFFRVTATNCVSRRVESLTQTSGTATVSSTNHGFSNLDFLIIEGANESDYNKYARITVVNADTFTYSVPSSAQLTATGSISASEGMSIGFYNANSQTVLPTTLIPESQGVINCTTTGIKQVNFDTPWTTPVGGFFWVGIAASRRTGNASLITIPSAAATTNLGIRGILFGNGPSTDMQQFRGGMSVIHNQIFDDYNNISQLPNSASPIIQTASSSSSSWVSDVMYIGIQ
jgi:hypothetical protein